MKIFKTLLLTGASSGIGQGLALHYAAPGCRLLLTGRDAARLDQTAAQCREKGAEVHTAVLDALEAQATARQILAWDEAFEIDLLIANAGISGGSGGQGLEGVEAFRRILRVNVEGVMQTVEPLIPRLKARGRGQIALMGSMAGFRGLPSAVAYSVSKNAVRAYAEALRPLLKPHGVVVSLICPGFVRTPLTDVNTFAMPFLMEPAEAARRIAQGLEEGKAVVAFPRPLALAMTVLRFLPRDWADWVVARAPKKP